MNYIPPSYLSHSHIFLGRRKFRLNNNYIVNLVRRIDSHCSAHSGPGFDPLQDKKFYFLTDSEIRTEGKVEPKFLVSDTKYTWNKPQIPPQFIC